MKKPKRKPKKNLLLKTSLQIPIINLDLWLFVARDACAVYNSTAPSLFNTESDKIFHARAVRGRGRFGLYFHSNLLQHDDVGHEVRHVTDFILDYLGHEIALGDEFGTYLTGYITQWLYRQFHKAKIRVSL